MDGRPNQRNKAVFLNSSSEVRTGPKVGTHKAICYREVKWEQVPPCARM